MSRYYKGVIFTNHALQRLSKRGISQGDAWATFRRPDQSRYAESKGAWVYYKTCGNRKIEVVAKKNEKGEWVVLSVWSKPFFEKAGKERKVKEPFIKKLVRLILGKH